MSSAREQAARREAEATAEKLVRLQSITGPILSDLPLDTMLRELVERIREVVMVDTAVVLMVEGADAALVLGAAAGTDVQVDATVELARRGSRPKGHRRTAGGRPRRRARGRMARGGVAKPSAR